MAVKTILAGVVAAVAALISGWMGMAMKDDGTPDKLSLPRRISVRLLGRTSEITGVAVPTHVLAAERGSEFFQVDEPSVVAVTLPEGRVITLPVKTVFITTQVDVRAKSSTVVDVALLPLLKSVPYREAVAEVRRLMREMDIEPDERMQKKMAVWPNDSGPIKYRASMNFNKDSGIMAEVRPAPGDGWYIVFTFEAGADARRVLWDPNFKPPAEEKGKEPHPDSGRK